MLLKHCCHVAAEVAAEIATHQQIDAVFWVMCLLLQVGPKIAPLLIDAITFAEASGHVLLLSNSDGTSLKHQILAATEQYSQSNYFVVDVAMCQHPLDYCRPSAE